MTIDSFTGRDFDLIRELVHDTLGIQLRPEKRGIVFSRMRRLLEQGGFKKFGDFYDHLLADRTRRSLVEIIEHITTNYTFFNRESEHFKFVMDRALPGLERPRASAIQFWSAGCATGEEPYTLAMYLCEYFGNGVDPLAVRILATDISRKCIQHATRGRYSAERCASLPESFRDRYLTPAGPGEYSVHERVRRLVTFRVLNLKRPGFPFVGKFDFIFCRNVQIYFDETFRRSLAEQFARVTRPDGFLLVGQTESLVRPFFGWQYVQPSIFRRVEF